MTHEPQIIEVEQPVNAPAGEVINQLKLCFIWIGEIQYELIQAITDPLGIYANAPRTAARSASTRSASASPTGTISASGWTSRTCRWRCERDIGPGQLKFLYLDGRAKFGHYLEYTWMTDAAWDQTQADVTGRSRPSAAIENPAVDAVRLEAGQFDVPAQDGIDDPPAAGDPLLDPDQRRVAGASPGCAAREPQGHARQQLEQRTVDHAEQQVLEVLLHASPMSASLAQPGKLQGKFAQFVLQGTIARNRPRRRIVR